jgi:hypothetical protein
VARLRLNRGYTRDYLVRSLATVLTRLGACRAGPGKERDALRQQGEAIPRKDEVDNGPLVQIGPASTGLSNCFAVLAGCLLGTARGGARGLLAKQFPG